MYAIFEKILITNNGKALVCTYQQQYSAKQIYKKLQDYALHFTKATLDALTLLQYITTADLSDGN